MWKITLLLLLVHCCYADYIGAVVEYNPVTPSTPNVTIEENIKKYIYQMEIAKNNGVQIIVFPEYGLTGLVENPEGFAIVVPNVGTSNFENSSEFLLRLSNAAHEHGLYVVVNLLEQIINTDNSTTYYNTNLVFADNGTLVAKYRKINLFGEPKLTPGNEIVTFTTNFGTFGLITCMDILYNNPSQTVLANTGVTDVIYTAAWNSYLPFYMSIEVQVGYALANNVNLLASNLNDPSSGKGGSGIFGRDGVVRRILTDSPAVNMLYSNIAPPNLVKKGFHLRGFDIISNETRQPLSNYKTKTDFEYNSYVFKGLDLSQENITDEICYKGFCCSFNIVALKNEINSSEVYKLVAYDGKAKFGTQQVHIKHCNLVACLNQETSSCGQRPPQPYTTRFRQILVWGNFENQPEQFFRPSSLGGNLDSIYNVTYLENKTNQTTGISFNITQPVSNVVLFGLYGKSAAETFSISIVFVTIMLAVQRFF